MMTNLLFSQANALGKRLAMVLTVLFTLGVGSMLGQTFTRISAASDLSDGDEIIFVNQDGTYACGTTQNNNNRTPVAITTSSNSYSYKSSDNVQVFIVKVNGSNYGFHNGSGYIYSASSSNNYLRTNTTASTTAPSGTAAWTLSVSNNVFTVKNASNTNYYLAFNGTSYFSQYKSGQSKPYIYKKNAAPTCTPLKMSTVTATPGDSKITLTWSAVDNASNYTVTCPGGTVGSVTGASTKTCTITGLTNGTSYNWSVMPVGNGTTYCEENTPATGSTTPNATYSITYHDKDGAHSVDALGGSALLEVLPNNPTSCDIDIYPYFVGWSTTDIPSGGTAEQPTLVSAEIVNSTTSSKTYYAVWSDVDPNAGGGSWEKATSISVGDKVVFVHEEKKRELTGVASNIGTATERTNGIPNGIEGTYVLTIEAGTANNSYSFKNGSNYLSWPSGSNNLYTSNTKNNASSWTINTSTDGNFKFANVGTTSRILQFNSGSPRWACYTTSQSAFQIYKQSTAAGTATYITTCPTETSR